MIKSININSCETAEIYKYLSNSITPRPIAFVSSVDEKGNKNLSPFSFFNVFSVNPPILIFSPVRRVRNNTSKHTLENVKAVKECVISLVTEEMAQQVSLSSCDFKEGVNEFEKAGFTELKSDKITPPRIKESPINFECKVNQLYHLLMMGCWKFSNMWGIKDHINEDIIDGNNDLDPMKLKIVSRYERVGMARLLKNRYMKLLNQSLE